MNEPIASGREADIFALDAGRVLRRYRRVTDVTGEAAVMTHVAAHGYPVPAVYQARGSDMVLERLDGPTMAQAMVTGELSISDGAALLAALMDRLHKLPPLKPPPEQLPSTKPALTQPPQTQLTSTQPPSTQAASGHPPSTQPPSTQALSGQPPLTQPPSTQAASGHPPSTQPPSTQALSGQPPLTQPPSTQAPSGHPPSTQPPSTQALSGRPPFMWVAGSGGSVVHLDMHPENVIMTGRGPVVIDWCNATDGEPDLDVALSALMLAQVEIDRSHPWSAAAGEFLDTFLDIAPGDPLRLLDDAVSIKSRQSTITPEEVRALGTAAGRVRGDH